MTRRLLLVAGQELFHNLRRPLFWFWAFLLAFAAWSLAQGNVRIQTSGDASVGGEEQWLTSEFAFAHIFTALLLMIYSFFVCIAAGMTIIRDDELKVGELLHGTPLGAGEYAWGKFTGATASFIVMVAAHLAFVVLFMHAVPNPATEEIRGPLELSNYLRPALIFGVPMIVFLAGASFAIGELTRRPIVVFLLPVGTLIICAYFLWNWAPSWLDPGINRFLMLIDPTGYRWLYQTWLKVDLGVEYYNTQHISFDSSFLASRLITLLAGLALVAMAARHLAVRLRGAKHGSPATLSRAAGPQDAAHPDDQSPAVTQLRTLQMTSRPPGLMKGIATVARFELRELRYHPGLYLFTPFILSQTLGTALLQLGVFDTPVLLTPGTLAMGSMNTLTVLICLLLLFYTVESQRREHNTGLAPIYYATAVRGSSILFGKLLANAAVGAAILLAAFTGCAIALLIQGRVGLDLGPFLLVWLLLLVPTFMLFSSFVSLVAAITRNRYTTYALVLGVLIYTFYRQFTGKMNWVGNWNLWSIGGWSDLGAFELNGRAILLNRVMAIGLTVLFTAAAVRLFARRDFDAARIIHRLRPRALLKYALQLLPFAVVPAVCAGILWTDVNNGFQGERLKAKQKDYWKQNLATWKDAPLPSLRDVFIDLELDPDRRWFSVDGVYVLANDHTSPLQRLALTGGSHWRDVTWTMNGLEYEPQDRTSLYVFTPPLPLGTGATLEIGFRFHGVLPKGITANGGGSPEFILPSGVVLTSFRPTFAPILGYDEEIGVDEDNDYEPRDYPENFHEGITDPLFGSRSTFRTKLRITGPEDFTYNSVGTLVSDEVVDGNRTVVWESDYPVTFFNVVAGRWDVREGNRTKIFYHPGHPYNIDEMSEALDAAREYYSEWFMEYPWQELKLSEFPNLATYAQGFATNITFSEGIGFLTKSDPRTNMAFMVTAHEAAHAWWGNLLVPGKGPGGNILSEGMAHFSTILLFDQVKGAQQRIEFCKRIESRYTDRRRVDAERPLVKVDGSKAGDTTVTYDKGGWVFWMLLNHMGRERALAGMRQFISHYHQDPDHPVLEDFIATMRSHMPDVDGYDEFVEQWFLDVVIGEYRLEDVMAQETGNDRWQARARLHNRGTGRMPIEVAATYGERFDDDGGVTEDYREARITVIIGPGEAHDLQIECDFEPQQLIVDPDALVLQLHRHKAVEDL